MKVYRMRVFRFRSVLALVLLAPLVSLSAWADSAKPEAADSQAVVLEPNSQQSSAARWMAQLVSNSRFHYTPQKLDDKLSSAIFDRYLESLDADRLFFRAEDVAGFESYRTKLDDAILEGKLSPAFDIFNVYLQRVDERTESIRAQLKEDFDFEVDESYSFDREDASWAGSAAELDEVWRLRVKNDVLRLRLANREMAAIRDTLDKRYRNFARRVRQIDAEDVFQTFMNAYASEIEPHTAYMNPRTSENFNMAMRLSLEGIGAVLSRNDEEFTVVRSVVPGGPAAMSGKIKPGDRILAVGQGDSGPMVDVVGWRLDDVVDLIRGPKDSVVRLDVLPAELGIDGEHTLLTLSREKVKLEEQAAKKEIIEFGEGEDLRRIGVISLPAFYQDFEGRRRDEPDYRSATRDIAVLLEELRADKVEGVVIDLRNNGGGSLNEAIELTGLFIDKGPVVQVRDAGRRVSVESDRTSGVAWDGPLAVLVNRASASASEIFAGAIQDYGRGLIVGEPTFGKGTVQNLVDLDMFARENPGLGHLKITVAQFFRIAGGSTQHKGVVPDIDFPVTWDATEYGESMYDNALPWASISPAVFDSYGDFSPLVPELKSRHSARVATDQEFQWWVEDVAEYRVQRDRKTLSLNETERRAERQREQAKRESRDAQRKAMDGDSADAIASEDEVSNLDDGLQADERPIEADETASTDDKPDALLRETAHLLIDAVDLLRADSKLAARVIPETSPLRALAD
ncbi:carboxy terminal-processing peptidase [Aquimonas sp.]|uniref:carboxy terminal-processing peptidase n=1 Tax=Aquimonas sp. TaxID=1872588 RepID=UPI0037C12AD7